MRTLSGLALSLRKTCSLNAIWIISSKKLIECEYCNITYYQSLSIKKPVKSHGIHLSPRKTSSALSLQHLRELATCDQLYYLGRLNAIRNLLTNLCSVLDNHTLSRPSFFRTFAFLVCHCLLNPADVFRIPLSVLRFLPARWPRNTRPFLRQPACRKRCRRIVLCRSLTA